MEGRITNEDGTEVLGIATAIDEEDDILRFTTQAQLLLGQKYKVIQGRNGNVVRVDELPSANTKDRFVCKIIDRQPLSYDPDAQ